MGSFHKVTAQQAQKAMKRALDRGLIVKEGRCEFCGSTGPRIEGHHRFGYFNAFVLAIDWLCPDCHKGAHHSKPRGQWWDTPESIKAGLGFVRARKIEAATDDVLFALNLD